MAGLIEDGFNSVAAGVGNIARGVTAGIQRAASPRPANDGASARSSDTAPQSRGSSSFFQFGPAADDGAPTGGDDLGESWSRFGSSTATSSRSGSMVFAIGTVGIDYPTVAIRDRFEEIVATSKIGNRASLQAAEILKREAEQIAAKSEAHVDALREKIEDARSKKDSSLPSLQRELFAAEADLEARREDLKGRVEAHDSIKEVGDLLSAPDTESQLKPYLRQHVNEAPLLNWVFKIDGIETFIIQPQGPFSQQYFLDVLVRGLGNTTSGVYGLRQFAGVIAGGGRLGSGAVLPIVVPEPALLPQFLLYRSPHDTKKKLSEHEKKTLSHIVKRFRRIGMSSEDRAVNYVLADRLVDLFVNANERMDPQKTAAVAPEVESITASIADVSRPGSTSIYVHVKLFDANEAFRNLYVRRYTLDVSMPEPNIFEGDTHSWIERINRGGGETTR